MAAKKKTVTKAVATVAPRSSRGANGSISSKRQLHNGSVEIGETTLISPAVLPSRKRVRVEEELGKDEEFALKPEDDIGIVEDLSTIEKSLERPPPVNSDFLPLPWKGRLGYACLNTYLRYSNPPVFCSRTCRIASILEHRYPLQDPSQPEHSTKNKPDKSKKADPELGMKWVQNLGLANARDIVKMIRWNDKYGIKFMRLSSEMFPFASHEIYGYKLAPFASEVLAEAGKVIAELGHRVSVHPGQFTQFGSPRKEVIENSIRDLEYHDEMLSLLRLPEQQNRDAVMILHMGGTYGSKEETLDRFRTNYARLSDSIKRRLVLENDDMSWSVHDLLPICQELNIPMVLDFHHHNIIFDSTKLREGTMDIIPMFPEIKQTWTRKGITQKMHYSEPRPTAITPMQRRRHNPRVDTLPPCAPDMDLMIEAKDKEQAVFELMRKFKLPGYDLFNDIVPHVRTDENIVRNRKAKDEETVLIPDEEVGMGGTERRVYWPPEMEDWLRPKKRERPVKSTDEVGDEINSPKKTPMKKAVKVSESETPIKRRSAKKKVIVPTPSDTASDVEVDESLPRRRSGRGQRVSYKEDMSE